MFRIEEVSSPRCKLKFSSRTRESNQVSVITGPNGSGKTEILKTLSDWFSRLPQEQAPEHLHVRWKIDTPLAPTWGPYDEQNFPPRVIAQTFSPFSRFAPPKRDTRTLFDVYANQTTEQCLYRTIGIHSGTQVVGGPLGKLTLEQGIFRLSEAPEQTQNLGSVLDSLRFERRINLQYRKNAIGESLFSAYTQGHLRDLLSGKKTFASNVHGISVDLSLRREIRDTGIESLSNLLENVLSALERYLDRDGFQFVLDFREKQASLNYAALKALSLLRRLDALTLERCELYPHLRKQIDLADASSGQQQMLCSLFGLFGELSSNSLVLIDEPELSLHPTWQMGFFERLDAILQPFEGCHVIIATHSPLIVQSALKRDFEVIQLRADTPNFQMNHPLRDQSHASVEGTLLEVFGTPVTGSAYLANELFEMVSVSETASSEIRKETLVRLEWLESLYQNSQGIVTQKEDLDLIQRAIRLVKVGGE
ncbi:ABC-type transport system involved in cytochrome c biogenesis ATPase subunit [Paraburkholderia sp. GAS333]|uniref:ATP-binding protein n=1 Tax=Paraburkholderia sp. GAS333 TaxID=3156279 RepID=UPI003D24A3A8